MSPQKNYGCESNSESLCSIAGLSECSSSKVSKSESCSSSTSNSSCSSNYEHTLIAKSSCSNSEPSSCSEKSISSSKCESICQKECAQLVKKYNCSKIELLAIKDVLLILTFLSNKLKAVQPNVVIRNVQCYNVHENIAWLESFVDTLFCVLRKNEAYKVVTVKECKLKNDCDEYISNRVYLIKVNYNDKNCVETKLIKLELKWTQLSNNSAKAYNGILDYAIAELKKQITIYEAEGTFPFLS